MNDKTILLVEDNSGDEALIKRALFKAQIKNELVVVRDGAEALDYLFCTGEYASASKLNKVPQVILLDLKLPKISGLEVLKRLRADERTKLLPIVILTSSNEEQDVLAGYKEGANSYIVKPINAPSFTDCIRQLGLYWLGLNESVPN